MRATPAQSPDRRGEDGKGEWFGAVSAHRLSPHPCIHFRPARDFCATPDWVTEALLKRFPVSWPYLGALRDSRDHRGRCSTFCATPWP